MHNREGDVLPNIAEASHGYQSKRGCLVDSYAVSIGHCESRVDVHSPTLLSTMEYFQFDIRCTTFWIYFNISFIYDCILVNKPINNILLSNGTFL